jgi:hypothetical protein
MFSSFSSSKAFSSLTSDSKLRTRSSSDSVYPRGNARRLNLSLVLHSKPTLTHCVQLLHIILVREVEELRYARNVRTDTIAAYLLRPAAITLTKSALILWVRHASNVPCLRNSGLRLGANLDDLHGEDSGHDGELEEECFEWIYKFRSRRTAFAVEKAT